MFGVQLVGTYVKSVMGTIWNRTSAAESGNKLLNVMTFIIILNLVQIAIQIAIKIQDQIFDFGVHV